MLVKLANIFKSDINYETWISIFLTIHSLKSRRPLKFHINIPRAKRASALQYVRPFAWIFLLLYLLISSEATL